MRPDKVFSFLDSDIQKKDPEELDPRSQKSHGYDKVDPVNRDLKRRSHPVGQLNHPHVAEGDIGKIEKSHARHQGNENSEDLSVPGPDKVIDNAHSDMPSMPGNVAKPKEGDRKNDDLSYLFCHYDAFREKESQENIDQ